jgi:hypothetical protein
MSLEKAGKGGEESDRKSGGEGAKVRSEREVDRPKIDLGSIGKKWGHEPKIHSNFFKR